MASLSLSLLVSPSLQGWGQLHRLALANSGMGLLNMIDGPNDRDVTQVPASGVMLVMAYTLSSAFTEHYYGQVGKRRIYENSFSFIFIRQSADSAQCELFCLKIVKIIVHVIKDYG